MNVYVFQAALFCETCGESLQKSLPPDPDSDRYPQGPYGNGGGEADAPQHCDNCGAFLENPLTSDGVKYVREALKRAWQPHGVKREWKEFYQDQLEEVTP
jgi:hypothetical protein